jgi:hypothetical protein
MTVRPEGFTGKISATLKTKHHFLLMVANGPSIDIILINIKQDKRTDNKLECIGYTGGQHAK